MVRLKLHFLVYLLVLLFFCMPPLPAQVQTAGRTDENNKDVTTRFNKIIDDIVDRLQQEVMWQMGYDDTLESTDTTSMRITFDGKRGAIHFTGDVVIDERDRIDGNIVVRDGSLTVRGRIDGDVLVLNGNVYVETGGFVGGTVTTMNGTVHNTGGEITGRVEEKEGVEIAYTHRETKSARRVPYRLTNELQEDLTVRDLMLNPFFLGFNRVEGFSIGLGSKKNLYWDGSMGLSLYGQVGYAFKAHRWRAQLGGTRQVVVGTDRIIEFGGEVYSLTDSKDRWIMDRFENDLAAFFFNYDYLDYYDREGFSVYAGHYFDLARLSGHLRLQYLNEMHTSMPNRTDWSLFSRSRSYRENPMVDEGRLNAIRVALNVSSVKPIPHRLHGWNILAALEYTSPDVGGAFDYTQYILDVRRYQPISDYDTINLRLRVGSSERDLPVQRMHELGGLGTMPGFPHKSFTGNRMLLFNAEYVLRGTVLNQLLFVPRNMFGGLTLLLFMDTGWTDLVDPSFGAFQGFDELSLRNLKTSLGLGLGSRDGAFRVGFAWRTDRAGSPAVFVRIARPF
jgi:cytoskeletal protein CcmA (bactofilin family)